MNKLLKLSSEEIRCKVIFEKSALLYQEMRELYE
jgi:hypothetical protein